MSSNLPLHPWARLLAVTFLTTGQLLHADDKPPVAPNGDKMIAVKSGDKTTYVKVHATPDPLRNIASTDTTAQYDPTRIFSRSSSMANKSFAPNSTSISKSDSLFTQHEQSTFITQPYFNAARSGGDHSTPNLGSKVPLPVAEAAQRNATGFNKKFSAKADTGLNKTAVLAASDKSSYQDRTAVLEKPKTGAFASPMANKTFQGVEADDAKRHLTRDNNGQIHVMDLPNRPLTIDEVRNLINHGFKPNTDVKPDEPSKPLNDPDYKPEPMRESPPPSREDDKDDAVPPPGTMAQPPPENSEPLPQH